MLGSRKGADSARPLTVFGRHDLSNVLSSDLCLSNSFNSQAMIGISSQAFGIGIIIICGNLGSPLL